MTPPSVARLDVEALLQRFEDAWHGGTPPAIGDFLVQADDRGTLLEELVKIDLDYRWRQTAHERWTLEHYLERFPELRIRDLLPLLSWEYRARRRWGDQPTPATYTTRFPVLAARLSETLARIDADLAREFATRRMPLRPLHDVQPTKIVAPPPVDAVADVVGLLRDLLPAEQLSAVTTDLSLFPAAADLTKDLVQRGWLTAFQAEQLLAGHGRDLVLGPYVLRERLGAGGAGQVFQAFDRDHQRLVALKLIRPDLLQDPEVLQRFYREIRIVGQLDHPNLVKGYESGPIGAVHCLAMEYVAGIDLARLVQQSGPLSVASACAIIRQVALGLQHAHERQLVHRDIKPPNILVSGGVVSGGVVSGNSLHSPLTTHHSPLTKILDLGLARLRPSADAGDATGMITTGQGTSLLTPAGAMMMGTPDYLAPEQALDFHAADSRADIYSLGCTFFFLLTGRPPFPGGTLAQKLLWHQHAAAPAIAELRPDVPAELARVLGRMLAKRPEDRYQTPGEVAVALANPAYQKLQQAPRGDIRAVAAPVNTPTLTWPTPPRSRGAGRRAVVLLLALAVAATGLFFALRPRNNPNSTAPQPVQGSTRPTPELMPLPTPSETAAAAWTALLARATGPGVDTEALRRDTVDLRSRYPGTPQAARAGVLLMTLPSPLDKLDPANIPEAQRLSGQPKELVAVLGEHRASNYGDVFRLAFSPDGATLACGTTFDKTVRLWDLAGAAPKRVSVVPGYSYATNALGFTPDGQELSFIGDGCVVRRWDLTRGRPLPWAVVLGPTSGTMVSAVAFAADGQALAYGGADCTVHLWDLARTDSRERAVLTGHTGTVIALAFTPDGRTLASSANDRLIRLWDLKTTPPRELAVLKGHTQRVQGLAFTPDGRTLVSCGNDSTVRAWDVAKQKETASLRIGNSNFVAVALTPDGKRVAACTSAGLVAWWDLESKTKLGEAKFSTAVWNVAFAPDGRHLATGNGDGTIYLLRLGPGLPGR